MRAIETDVNATEQRGKIRVISMRRILMPPLPIRAEIEFQCRNHWRAEPAIGKPVRLSLALGIISITKW